jgi:hypothetical protein
MDASSPPGRKRFFSSVTEYKNVKRTPASGKDRTSGTRVIELTNWRGDNGGCYLTADINGTAFAINQRFPLLQPLGLKLCDDGDTEYYDFSWNHHRKIHIVRTISRKHADQIANGIINRCTDLHFRKDFSDGKWYDDKGLMVCGTPRSRPSRSPA